MSRWLFFPFLDPFIPDGEFAYCAFSESQLATFRPVGDGTFVYCAFDLNNSGFDRSL